MSQERIPASFCRDSADRSVSLGSPTGFSGNCACLLHRVRMAEASRHL